MLVLNEQEEIKDKIARRVPVIARKSSQDPKHTRKRIHQAKKNFLEKFKTASQYVFYLYFHIMYILKSIMALFIYGRCGYP